jgi:hypothetical protein
MLEPETEGFVVEILLTIVKNLVDVMQCCEMGREGACNHVNPTRSHVEIIGDNEKKFKRDWNPNQTGNHSHLIRGDPSDYPSRQGVHSADPSNQRGAL